MRGWRHHVTGVLLATLLSLLVGGLVAAAAGAAGAAEACWTVATLIGLAASAAWLVQGLRAGSLGVDIVAALGLLGSLVVGEFLAGAIVAVMLATGRVLEARAEARAQRELRLLVARSPRTARRMSEAGIVQVPVADVAVGDRLVVGAGEVVPVDGRLVDTAVLDESTLTGEPLPVERGPGDDVRSGAVSAGSPFHMVATATAERSTYAGIVRLVEQAQASSAPFVRVADRGAAVFVPFTLALAAAAWWWSGDPVRAVAVLVVATPCPLLLAAPVAVISGVSRAARRGVIMKGGGPLERLASVSVLLFDKTGTLTRGRPALEAVVVAPPAAGSPGTGTNEVLHLAASVDQVSGHVLAGAVVRGARARGLVLSPPGEVAETAGRGIAGTVDGREVRVGREDWVGIGAGAGPQGDGWVRAVRRRTALDGSIAVWVSVDGRPVGALVLRDEGRPDAPGMLRALRAAGIRRTVLVTGDRRDVAESLARLVGVDQVRAQQTPAQKVETVLAERANGRTAMCGDGVNDAPALAAADVGIALAAHGSTASAEAADILLTTDRIAALGDAIVISRRSGRVARQAVAVGMGLSLIGMGLAAVGLLAPTAGALVQEGIDVLAILLALRAALPGRDEGVRLAREDEALAVRLATEHDGTRGLVERVREVADGMPSVLGPAERERIRELVASLETELLPHEEAEERDLIPLVERVYGSGDPLGGLSRTHAEIAHQVRRLRRLVEATTDGEAGPEDAVEMRRALYGLYGVLRLHTAQEDEGVYSLLGPPSQEASGVR